MNAEKKKKIYLTVIKQINKIFNKIMRQHKEETDNSTLVMQRYNQSKLTIRMEKSTVIKRQTCFQSSRPHLYRQSKPTCSDLAKRQQVFLH